MPENTVYVGRPTRWGNPYKVGQVVGIRDSPMTAIEAVECYRGYITANRQSTERWHLPIAELRGKNLACWCPLVDKDGNKVPCHADVLLEIANQASAGASRED